MCAEPPRHRAAAVCMDFETADGQKDDSVRQRERKRGQVQAKLLIRYGTFSSHSRELVFSTFKENPTEALGFAGNSSISQISLRKGL